MLNLAADNDDAPYSPLITGRALLKREGLDPAWFDDLDLDPGPYAAGKMKESPKDKARFAQ